MTYTIAATTNYRTIHSWLAGTDRTAAVTCARDVPAGSEGVRLRVSARRVEPFLHRVLRGAVTMFGEIRYEVKGVSAGGSCSGLFVFSATPEQGDTIAQVLGAYLMYGHKPCVTSEVHIRKEAPVRRALEGSEAVYQRYGCPEWWKGLYVD